MLKKGQYILLLVLLVITAAGIYITTKEKKPKISKDSNNPKYFNASKFNKDPLMHKRVILINGKITESLATRVIKQLLVLESNSAGKPITLLLNTPGGKRSQWQSMVQTMDFLASPVNVIAIGNVTSAGAYILANATGKKIIHERALVGIHMVFKKDKGEFSNERANEKNIREYWSQIKLPENFFPESGEKFNEFFYINAEQALKYGLVDEIYRKGNEPLILFNNNVK